MATISGAVLCAAVATLFWTSLGFALTRRLVPARLALPFAPAVGFAVHSALALPVFFFVPFTPAAIAAVAMLVLVAAVVASSRIVPPPAEKPPVWFPGWSYGLAALLAMVPAAAVLPKLSGDAVFLADPVFDHAKVALIDDMARLGLPPGNPFFADGGAVRLLLPLAFQCGGGRAAPRPSAAGRPMPGSPGSPPSLRSPP